MPAPKKPETVRALEGLQEDQRAFEGATISPQAVMQLLREDMEREIIAEQLDAGGGFRDMQEGEVAGRVARAIASAGVDDPSQWSKYESPAARAIIADFSTRIEAAVEKLGRSLPEVPAVGTLMTGGTGAHAQHAPSGATVILIDNGFFKFTHALAQTAVFGSFDLQDLGGFSDGAVQPMSDLVATHTVMRTCLFMNRRKTPPSVDDAVEAYRDAVGLFVLGHEYAHVANGDLDAHPLGDATPGVARDTHFRADSDAFAIAAEATREHGVTHAGVYGAFLYLAGVDVLERATAIYRGEAPPGETDPVYPTPFERLTRLLKELEEPCTRSASLRSAVGAAIQCYHVILTVFDHVAVALGDARTELAGFEPRARVAALPEMLANGAVTTLWRYVLAARGASPLFSPPPATRRSR